MPTFVSDNESHSYQASPVQSLELPQLPPPQQHYHHRFPSHLHPSYQRQLQHMQNGPQLPPPPPPPAQTRPPPPPPTARRYSSTKPPGRRFSGQTARSTPWIPTKTKKADIPRRPSKYQQHYNQGPKWIHRQGPVNGINYHWVETTSNAEDEGGKVTDKPLIILLHGFPQFWYTWRHQLVPLGEAGYRVVAPDLRGFNLTDKPAVSKRKTSSSSTGSTSGDAARDDLGTEKDSEAAYDMETLTADVRALMLHLGHDQAHIVGHDWGGIIAWAFAARFPQHISKLVVMNAPHLCRWRDVSMDYSSASCFQQTWWTCWYTMCCQLLPSWVPETVLSYDRSWMLTHNMTSSPSYATRSLSCISTASIADANVCAALDNPNKLDGCVAPGAGGCAGFWKPTPTDMDYYRDAISQPGAIYSLLEYYRNLWLSIQQMEQYGKIRSELPILVLWGLKDKTFPRETYAQGWDQWIDQPSNSGGKHAESSVTVSYLDCGHFTPEEAPEDVNRSLLDFFGPATCSIARRATLG